MPWISIEESVDASTPVMSAFGLGVPPLFSLEPASTLITPVPQPWRICLPRAPYGQRLLHPFPPRIPARHELGLHLLIHLALVVVGNRDADVFHRQFINDPESAAPTVEVEPIDLETPAHPALFGERQDPVSVARADSVERAALDE